MERIAFNEGWVLCEGGKEKSISLPHDAMIHETRREDCPGGAALGYFPGGRYVYRKTFQAPRDWADKKLTFCFEGVYKNAVVSVNGQEVGGCAYGYSQFYVSAEDALNYGEENCIEVRVSNDDQPNSRWYTGSGIYRPVQLLISGQSHIDIQGVKISTLSHTPARIKVEVSHTGGDQVDVEILRDNRVVAQGTGSDLELEIPKGALWSAEEPNLYQCRVTLREGNRVVDEAVESFGIRLVTWSPKGLFVNGKETLLRGGCVHHAHEILGAACYDVSEDRLVRRMKEFGFNAIRSAHNPCSAAMLTACDRYGMYMIDETWDMWYNHKTKGDYAKDFEANYLRDIDAMIQKDFNHPSVILYSIGNEVGEPAEERGVALAQEMVSYIHERDRNRGVTAGFNLMIILKAAQGDAIYKEGEREKAERENPFNSSLDFNNMVEMIGAGMNNAANSAEADQVTAPVLDSLDIAGYNYASGRYAMEGELHPDRVLYGSETFPQDIVKNWRAVMRYPYLVGDFMWTAWDYLGEAGMGSWNYDGDTGFEKAYPWLLADGGALDILGNPGGEAYQAAVVWGALKKPVITVRPVNHPETTVTKAMWRGTNSIPSWGWKNCQGNEAYVEVYTNAYKIELKLGGKSLGIKEVEENKAVFEIQYAPETLEAVAYDEAGKELGHDCLQPALGETRIRLTPETRAPKAGEVVYVDVTLVGENGAWESNCDSLLTATVTGGLLLAFGSANPKTTESYDQGSFTSYYGKAQAILKIIDESKFSLTVQGEHLAPETYML